MKRRGFLGILGGAAAWSVAARAQQQTIPIVGLLRGTPSAPFPYIIPALLKGLREEGFFEDRNVAIEARYADNQLDRLPTLAADLIDRKVAVIVCNNDGAQAAK